MAKERSGIEALRAERGVSGLATVKELVGALVHPDARASDLDRAEHAAFIATRLGLTFAAIAALAVGFAAGHVPAPWEAVALAWLTLPLGAAMLLSRTGRLDAARAVSVSTWAGFGATACFGGGLSIGGGCAILTLIVVEAIAASSPNLLRFGVVTAVVGLLPPGAAELLGLLPGRTGHDLPFIAPSLVYGFVVAAFALDLRDRVNRRRADGDRLARVAADLSGDLVLRCDRSGSVLDAGRAGEGRFGVASRDLLGRGTFDRVHVADRPAFLKAFGDVAADGATATALLRLRTSTVATGRSEHRDPVFTWIELRVGRREAADPTVLVAVLRDASVQVRQQASADDARREARRAAPSKDAFIASLSHELRTPLNAIIGFSEILASPDLAPADPTKRQEYAGIITASGQHLLSVVTSLLDMSKLEAGRFELLPDAFDAPTLIQACCDMIGLQAERVGVALHHERSGGPVEVVGDTRACRQIVINLLSNALKFTGPGGRVAVGARVLGRSVVISVADTGVGIAAADLGHVGDAFFQGTSGYDRAFEGTGLGLSVVRGLVGVHGGRITIESAVGEGTRVQVHLPLDCRSVTTGGSAAVIDVVPRSARDSFVPAAVSGRMQKRA